MQVLVGLKDWEAAAVQASSRTGQETCSSPVYVVSRGEYARVEVAPRISDDALARLVAEAAGGAEDPAAALLGAVLLGVDEAVAMQVAGTGLPGEVGAGVRVRAVEDVVVRLISPSVLAAWSTAPAGRCWRFLDERAQELGPRAVDRAWIDVVAVQRERRSEALLLARLRRRFDAAARRHLAAADHADVGQDFVVWLMKDDYAALRRWSPEGGSSFDGWFFARAVHHIASWRRRRSRDAGPAEPEALAAVGPTPDVQAIVMQRIDRIRAWVQRDCSEYQQAVFQRWFLEEQSAAEIAAALDTTTAAVHMTVSRLRKAILAAVCQ